MKQQSAKQFFSTQAGKLTLAIIAMVVCWTVLIVYLSNTSTGGTWFPTEVDMNRVRQDIKKDTNTLAAEQANKQAYDALEDQYEDSLATYWNADRDGEPETELRNLVNDAATRAGANLQNLGSVRMSSINSELSYADLDFTLVDEYLKVIQFFAEVEKSTPRLSWRRVEIRLEPTRARAVTGPAANRPGAATTTTTSTPAQTFRFNDGNLDLVIQTQNRDTNAITQRMHFSYWRIQRVQQRITQSQDNAISTITLSLVKNEVQQ